MVVYRTSGVWGAGQGSNLTPAQVDENFYELDQRIEFIETNPPVAVTIDYVTTAGNQMFLNMTDHSVIGPITIPVGTWNFKGEWLPDTEYFGFDVVTFAGSLYLINSDHTSEGSFDPSATNSFGLIYNLILEPISGGGGAEYPPGGDPGDALIKHSAIDNDVIWGQPLSGVPTGGTIGQLLAKSANNDYLMEWIDAPPPVPAGGLAGQILAKHTDIDYDTEWVTPPEEATQWIVAAGPPTTLYNDGDIYLNSVNGDFYNQVSAVWQIQGNLRGATGAAGTNGTNGLNGTVWRSGTGAPSSGLGVNGDFYINFTTGDYYLKSSGTYSVVGNIAPLFPGGTTGQVLTKASNTDYDYTWSTPSGGGGGSSNWPRRNGSITAPGAISGWTTIGTGTFEDFTAGSNNGVRIRGAGNGSNHLVGIYKARSFASDFTCKAGIRLHTPIVDSLGFGLLVWNTSNTKGYFMGIGNAGLFARWKYNGGATSFDGTNDYGSSGFGGYGSKTFIPEFYLRVSLVGTDLNWYWSYDGNYWMLLKTLTVTEYNASSFDSIGLAYNRNLNTGNFNFEIAMDCADFDVA